MSIEGIDPEVALGRLVNMIPSGCSLQNSFGWWFYGPTEPGHEMFSGKTPTEALMAAGLRHDSPPTICRNYLTNGGQPYPRSCPTCGHAGPCRYGTENVSKSSGKGPSIFDRPTVREPKGHG